MKNKKGRRIAGTLSGSQKPAGSPVLSAPVILQTDPGMGYLHPAAIGSSGVTVRVSAYEGMMLDQRVTLYWNGKVDYSRELRVTEAGCFMDFSLPRSWVLESSFGQWGGVLTLYYTVSGFAEGSSPTHTLIINDAQRIKPATVPDFPNGQFDPFVVPQPGVRIAFPIEGTVWALWTSYGRDGHRIATAYLPAITGSEAVVTRDIFDQTELGGDVWISYAAENSEGEMVESRFTRLQVVAGAPFQEPRKSRFLGRLYKVIKTILRQ